MPQPGLASVLQRAVRLTADLLLEVPQSGDVSTWVFPSDPSYRSSTIFFSPFTDSGYVSGGAANWPFMPFDTGNGLLLQGFGLRTGSQVVAFGALGDPAPAPTFVQGVVSPIVHIAFQAQGS